MHDNKEHDSKFFAVLIIIYILFQVLMFIFYRPDKDHCVPHYDRTGEVLNDCP